MYKTLAIGPVVVYKHTSYFYFVWLCGIYFWAFHVESFVLVLFFSPVKHCDRLAWERELVYVLLVYLFLDFSRVNLLSFFSSSWCQELVVACDFGTPWTFLLTFFFYTSHSVHVKSFSYMISNEI